MKSPNHRVFFAIDLSREIKINLLQEQEKIFLSSGTPIRAENFHITLSFLGNLSDKKIESILDNLGNSSIRSFEASLTHLIYFSSSKIIAIDVTKGRQNLSSLKNEIESKLLAFEHFNIEKKPYRPHVSLFRKVESLPVNTFSVESIFQINNVSLMETVATRKNVRYETIDVWPLADNGTIKEQLLKQRPRQETKY